MFFSRFLKVLRVVCVIRVVGIIRIIMQLQCACRRRGHQGRRSLRTIVKDAGLLLFLGFF